MGALVAEPQENLLTKACRGKLCCTHDRDRQTAQFWCSHGTEGVMTPERWRQITEIFHGALALDTAGRTAFVASRCGGDSALRREVESMIAAYQDAGEFGNTLAFDCSAPLDPGSSFGP